MELNPTEYGRMVNSLGQEIIFVEHPLKGEDSPIICVCKELELSALSTFYDLDDMIAEHKEYEPSFKDGKFYIGDSIEE